MSRSLATLIGLGAILFWSANVGLIRAVTESLGVTGGAALLYTLATVLLWCLQGLPDLRRMPRRYLLCGSLLFVSYEVCLVLSLGLARDGHQAIEVGLINYLWPAFTILFAILLDRQPATFWVVPGILLALAGTARVVGGEAGLSLSGLGLRLQDNPLSYALALAGALIWAGYCVATRRLSAGHNGITLFFLCTAATLWLLHLGVASSPMTFSPHALMLTGLAAAAMAFGYAAWNLGILHGHMTLLAGASYLTPVLSAALASLLLQAPLSPPFWQGAAMVCLGSTLCGLATGRRAQPRPGDPRTLPTTAPEPPRSGNIPHQ